jgi:hypothetical protein
MVSGPTGVELVFFISILIAHDSASPFAGILRVLAVISKAAEADPSAKMPKSTAKGSLRTNAPNSKGRKGVPALRCAGRRGIEL